MTTGPGPDRIRVLQSFGRPRATSNPYLQLLVDALTPVADVRTFSWRQALGGGYDVLHVHWPERLIRGRTRPTTGLRLVLLCVVLMTTRLRRQAIVRTLHNARPHETGSRAERFVLRMCDRRTTLFILLTATVPPPRPAQSVVIPHGHYREWISSVAAVRPSPQGPAGPGHRGPQPGRLLTFGLLRRYKGVEALLAAFADAPDTATLHVAGRVEDDATAVAVTAAAAADPRITAHLGFVPDAMLVDEIVASRCVALPYRNLTNSGAALLALSLDRPVLVPDNPATRELAAEVGREWVRLFDAPLTSDVLTDVLSAAAPWEDGGRPDLRRRDWPAAADAHLVAYRSALEHTGRR